MPHTTVIDLSHHNSIPQSLRPAYQAGVLGVIHKMTEGMGGVDKKCKARFDLAQDAGMLWGLYHFMRPGNMERQVNHFLSTADGQGVLTDDTLLAADYEDERISADQLYDFMQLLESKSGRKPVIYSGHVLKQALRSPHAGLNEYRLWLAQYRTGTPKMPTGWSNYWLWQWTDRGTVPGIEPPTDCNQYLGTASQLRAEWSGRGGGVIVNPAPDEPDTETTIIRITAPRGSVITVERE